MENIYRNEQIDPIFEQVLAERESLLIDLTDDPTIEQPLNEQEKEND